MLNLFLSVALDEIYYVDGLNMLKVNDKVINATKILKMHYHTAHGGIKHDEKKIIIY